MNGITKNRMDYRTPIEVALGIDEDGRTTASKLYEFLGMDKGHYARWIKANIIENEFATENEDYWRFAIDGETPTGGKIEREDYRLTASFAKKLSMKTQGPHGEEARNYFTHVEEGVKKLAIDRAKLPQSYQLLLSMAEHLSEVKLAQMEQAEQIKEQGNKLDSIEQKQEEFREAFRPNTTTDFQDWCHRSIARCAESPRFTAGDNRSEKYRMATAESYERLNQKRRCRLDYRLKNARANALQNGATRSAAKNISKLQVICGDKDLRLAYEAVVREMMLYYMEEVAA